jgi:CDP-glycerol glycerophosphotransferase
MPLLSLILAVHGEQAYIADCAESIFGQEFADVELIAIDDASRDHTPALLDELAERHPRVTVRHLEQRVGQGEARNLGLDTASGNYVWFVSATDRLPQGSLGLVAEQLTSTSPDVLVVHHSTTQALGRSRPGPHKKALARAAKKGPGPLDQHRALAGAAPNAWNKVLRRRLLTDLGTRFGSRAHDELTVTWPALLAAERIAALPAKCYERRLRANAAPERGSPFDVFEQYDAVFEAAGEHRELLVAAMLRHQLKLLDRVPEKDRREFFHRMSESYGRHGVGGVGDAGRSARLVAGDRYAAFGLRQRSLEARRSVSRSRARLRKRASRAAGKARRARLERHYRSRLRRPIDPDLAVFACYWYRGYSCNPRAIYEKARELVPAMRGVWIVKPEAVDALPAGVEHVVAGTEDYYETIARARYFVNNVNFPNHLVKREGTVHVMTHHGTPLKRMGLDQRDAPVSGARIDFAGLMRRCARWDYSVSASPFSTLVWEHAYPLPYESLEVGHPRNDVLVTATEEDVRRIRADLGVGADQNVLLYAPTHREYHDGYVSSLDLAAVADTLGPDYVVLSRAHYFYDDAGLRDGPVRDVSDHPSVEELMLAANVLITDYSSIMFDYAVLDRPIVIHAPDWEVYRTVRGTYFDLMEQAPGPVARTAAELIDALREGRAFGDDAAEARAAFRSRYCSLEDGHAAERVVRRVWFGEREAAERPAPAVVE